LSKAFKTIEKFSFETRTFLFRENKNQQINSCLIAKREV
jgi:hypothetical protein